MEISSLITQDDPFTFKMISLLGEDFYTLLDKVSGSDRNQGFHLIST